MSRRLELGPLVVALGAVLLLVSLFLEWYDGEITAWSAFEVWDLVLALVGVGALVVVAGLVAPEIGLGEARALPFLAVAVFVIVASQIIDPPPAAAGQDRAIGCWLALAAGALALVGAVLTFSRVSFAINVEGRDTRRRVAAVDARDPTTTTESGPLFSRTAEPEPEPEPEPAAEAAPPADKPSSARSRRS